MLGKTNDESAFIQYQIKDSFKVVHAYSSNKGCASPLVSLMGTLAMMGFPNEVQENLAGEYRAIINTNGDIEFDLSKGIK